MAEIINLNKVKKQRAKANKTAKADENRKKHGLSKAQKSKNESERDDVEKKLDGLRLYRPNKDDDDNG